MSAAYIAKPGCRDSDVYTCIGCEQAICPDCTPSPREIDRVCGDCYYTETDGAA
jgi:hypothetical protein